MSYLNLQKVKIALVHDALTVNGGSVNLVRQLIKMFPNCHLYTSIDEGRAELSDIREKLVKKFKPLPFINKYSNFSKLLIRNYWESLNFDDYDLVISSSDEFSSKTLITKPETAHISVIYTPTRFLYPEHSQPTKGEKNNLKKSFLLNLLRRYDFIAAARPDVLVAISETVKKRIKKYYRRDSVVIYPPVAVPDSPPSVPREKRNYYVYIGTLDKRKGLGLAVNTFKSLRKKLVIVGDGPEKEKLFKASGENIRFTGYLSEEDKLKILKKAKAFLFPSVDEDFGIAPIEALANGVPVIAHKSGALTETIKDGLTGVFFEEFSEASLKNAILKFEKMQFDPINCYKFSVRFSEDKFRKKFIYLVKKTLADIKSRQL